MLNTYIQNRGLNQTILYNNNNPIEFNETNWNANYDGNNTDISVIENNNGYKNRYHISLDNRDLANMLNVPSINMPIDRRLQLDFTRPEMEEPRLLQLELPEDNLPLIQTMTPNSYLSSPLSN